MCYVINMEQDNGEVVSLCYCLDKESAHVFVDKLECQDYTKEFEVVLFPEYEARRLGILYCEQYIKLTGCLSVKSELS